MKGLKALLKYLPPRDKNPKNKKDFKYIPKKIFQTWETNKVSLGMYDAIYTWIDKNPDWEYHFFDEDGRRNFIKDNFPKKVLDTYDILIPGAYKADLWRYCVLYIHGGVYCDIKMALLSALNEIIVEDIEFLSIKDKDRSKYEFAGYICQAFICAKPKHPFLKQAIDMIVENANKGYYGYDDLSPTGPGLLGRAINIVLKRPDTQPHLAGNNNISGYKFCLLPTPNFSTKICKADKNKIFLALEYSGFRQEQSLCFNKDISFKYQYCWYHNKVYTHGKVIRTTPEKVFKKRFKKELAGGAVRMYKSGNKKAARKEIIRIIKSGNFCWRLVEALFTYEIIKPVKKVFKF